MASSTSPFASSKETTNYARLCRLLVDVGCKTLRDTFDRVHPPSTLHSVLLSHKPTLQPLYTGVIGKKKVKKVLDPTQWGKLYPVHSPVTSTSFDITLLTVLLRNICGFSRPAAGWDSLPPPTDTSTADDIARVKYYRNTVYGHASQASVDDASFNTYWQEIREALVRLGGTSFRGYIDNLEHDTMDPDMEEHFHELMNQWKKDDDNIKEKLEDMEGNLEDKFVQMKDEIVNLRKRVENLRTQTREGNEKDHFDPSELIDGVRQLYETCEGWVSLFPWCEEFNFQLDDIYTRLKVIGRKKIRGTANGEIVNMSAIFKAHEECPKPRTVLIEGKPGIGKTTYCKKLVYDWATGKPAADDSFPKFEAVLLLKCRDIKSNIWKAIDDQLLPRDIQEHITEKFFTFIRNNQSRVLLVLDGLDELPANKLPEFLEIIQGRVLPKCHLVATSRHEAGMKVRRYCDTILEIEGFTEEDARKFIYKYFKNMEDLAQKLLLKLSDDEGLKDMTANPLNTALLCLLCEEFQGIFPESRTQLYLDIIECVLRRFRRKKGLPETREKLIEVYETELKFIGRIALNGLREGNLDFDERELRNHNGDLSEFGFLSVQPGGSKMRPCRRYAFLHKSFQELFAGYYLCCQLLCQEITPESLASDTSYFNELKQVLLFSCGILAVQCEETTVDLIAKLTAQVNKHGDITVPVVLACIAECKREKSHVHVDLARHFGSGLKLQNARVECSLLRDVHFSSFSEAVKVNATLTKLDLQYNYVGAVGAASLAEAIKVNTTLQQLHFAGNDIGDVGAISLSEAIKVNTTLTQLDFAGNNIGDGGASSLAEAIKVNTTVTLLDLGRNKISDVGAAFLAEAMKVNTTLIEFYLWKNNIKDAGAASFAQAIKVNTTLTLLDLQANDIGDAGAASLAEAIKVNTTLSQLRMGRNNISDAGTTCLAEAIKVNVNTTLTVGFEVEFHY